MYECKKYVEQTRLSHPRLFLLLINRFYEFNFIVMEASFVHTFVRGIKVTVLVFWRN